MAAVEENLLREARQRAGMTQQQMAERAGTSRTTLSDYENGKKTPLVDTAARLAGAAGFDLVLSPRPRFTSRGTYRGAPIMVPDRLPALPPDIAFAVVDLPLHLEWSGGRSRLDLHNRRDRVRAYELVLREGQPADVLRLIHPNLLIDVFEELNLPAVVRRAWTPVVQAWTSHDQ